MKNIFSLTLGIILLIIIFSFISLLSLYDYNTLFYSYSSNSHFNNNTYYFSNSEFFWPVPGYHTITSYFGKRESPANGASSNHSGIDIAAAEGSAIFSVLSGKVIYTGFYGANGHTVIIESNSYSIQYSHISPNYIVSVGDYIEKGNIIGTVGPKYITDIINNPYKDSSGKSTNGATTGPHLHITIKENTIPIDPLEFFNR